MKITALNQRAFVRLISATHHKPAVLRGLVDSDAEMEILAEIEGLTNQRLNAEREGLPGLDRRELVFSRRQGDLLVYGHTHINAAFCYTRKGGNRFNDEDRGAWYAAFDSLTVVEEVGYHRTRELSFISRPNAFDHSARYVELLADFIGDFHDITDEPNHPALNADPAIGYPEGQKLARQLREEGAKGLIYPSVRRPGGTCFVAFDPHIIQNVRPGATWDLVWEGRPEFVVRQVTG